MDEEFKDCLRDFSKLKAKGKLKSYSLDKYIPNFEKIIREEKLTEKDHIFFILTANRLNMRLIRAFSGILSKKNKPKRDIKDLKKLEDNLKKL